LIMGAGLIGCEYANDMHDGGFSVDVVAPCEQVMPSLLPREAAAAVQRGLESLGVRFHLGPLVSRVDCQNEGVRATLSNGEVLDADLVVSAIGLRPRLELAVKAGLQTHHGVVVNRLLETSEPDIYALGDCAEVDGLVLLYALPLMTAARALAKTLAGEPTPVSYGVMPVTVKTPAVPVVVAPPAARSAGQWHIEAEGKAVQAYFRDDIGQWRGCTLPVARVTTKAPPNKARPGLCR